jgi:hypothetical protein
MYGTFKNQRRNVISTVSQLLIMSVLFYKVGRYLFHSELSYLISVKII